MSRLETAVAKSSYVGAGKKLKATNQVGNKLFISHAPVLHQDPEFFGTERETGRLW